MREKDGDVGSEILSHAHSLREGVKKVQIEELIFTQFFTRFHASKSVLRLLNEAKKNFFLHWSTSNLGAIISIIKL